MESRNDNPSEDPPRQEEQQQGHQDEEGSNHHSNNEPTEQEQEQADNGNDSDSQASAGAVEPSYDVANNLSFFKLCLRFSDLWNQSDPSAKSKKNAPKTVEDKLKHLLPKDLMKEFCYKEGEQPQSFFPLLRLLCPDKDPARSFAMKEALIAKVYAQGFGMPQGGNRYTKLVLFTDPKKAGKSVGDFAAVLEEVLADKYGGITSSTKGRAKKKGSGLTVGQVNELLDDLQARGRKPSPSKKNKKGKKKEMSTLDRRVAWAQALRRRNLSPLEHRVLVSIIIGNMRLGNIGFKRILQWYNDDAEALYNAHNSLRAVCNTLCTRPDKISPSQQRKQQQTLQVRVDGRGGGMSVAPYLETCPSFLTFGTMFTPQFSNRTGFDRLLHHISGRHRQIEASAGTSSGNNVLAIHHPAFCIETKLDGERMVFHVSREGIVKVQTRNSRWYSDLYTPVLAPAIRKAVEKSGLGKLDLILDGEVIAWDNSRQETVPFGCNRTVANNRKRHLEQRGLMDPRDIAALHADDKDFKSVNRSNSYMDVPTVDYKLHGESCWLQFIAFDVVYVGGPGAAEVLDASVSKHVQPRPAPGSIMDLDLFERKKLLYRLLEVQDKVVEIVDTAVVRPNGSSVQGKEYFSPQAPTQQFGYPAYTLDSIACALSNVVPDRAKLDLQCRRGFNDEQISQARAHAVESIYRSVVEKQRQEGLLFKDLNTPYYLGDASRGLMYWLKFKPDYFDGAVASDIDLVIIGAYYASGLRLSGKPSAFLAACVDSHEEGCFIPCCKLNAMSGITTTGLNEFYDYTNYRPNDTGSATLGRWIEGDYENRYLPDFVSKRAYDRRLCEWQTSGWSVQKKDYPDLWIDPRDSRVVMVNAGEIQMSDAFLSGVTLRFPRIRKFRTDGDEKSPSDCETETDLWDRYNKIMLERSSTTDSSAPAIGTPPRSSVNKPSRFFTEEQYAAKQKKSRAGRSQKPTQVNIGAVPTTLESNALQGMVFAVQEGIYSLGDRALDAELAKEEGWFSEGRAVRTKFDVDSFVRKHGGRTHADPIKADLILGGRKDDTRVRTSIMAIERAIEAGGRYNTLKKQKTQKAQLDEAMAKHRGVLRWTFVYSLVHRWLKNAQNANKSIKEQSPELLHPSDFDYLALAGEADLCSWEIRDVSDLQRAMEFVASSSASKRKLPPGQHAETDGTEKRQKLLPWQIRASMDLDVDERWIMAGRHQHLWPYSSTASSTTTTRVVDQQVVLYPDIFGSDYGLALEKDAMDELSNGTDIRRWEDLPFRVAVGNVASSLPLARAMGAWVTPHLHEGVTHIVCDYLQDEQNVPLAADTATVKDFVDGLRYQRLLDRLRAIRRVGNGPPLFFVTPEWIREAWETNGN